MIKINQKINHAFWGSLGPLLLGFREPLGLLGVGGGSGRLSGPFGDSWRPLWVPLGVLGVCFADAWDSWGLFGHSKVDFWIFLGNSGSPCGSILACFWDAFSSCSERSIFP